MDNIPLLLLVQVILILLNAIFASAEIAVLSMNELKLQKLVSEGDRRAGRLSRLTANPAKFLATIQVAITLSGFLGSAFAAENFSAPLTDWVIGLGVTVPRATLEVISVVVITLILSYFTLIFGELVPKRVAMRKSEQLSLALSGLLSGIALLTTPLVGLLSVSTNGVLRLMGIDPDQEEDAVSEEDIRMMVDAGSDRGAIDHQEKEFIQNVFEFDDLNAGELSTHRTEVLFLHMEDSDRAWADTIRSSRHTLYPICKEDPDHVIGILNAKDYFRLADQSRSSVMERAVTAACFVPETLKADVLFRNMKQDRISMAVVLDEHGGMVGVVTLSDLIEALVGDLNDQPPTVPEPWLEQTTKVRWNVHGNVSLEDIEDASGVSLEQEVFETLTGLAFDRLGMVPADGPQDLKLEFHPFSLHITQVEKHQIREAVLVLEEEP